MYSPLSAFTDHLLLFSLPFSSPNKKLQTPTGKSTEKYPQNQLIFPSVDIKEACLISKGIRYTENLSKIPSTNTPPDARSAVYRTARPPSQNLEIKKYIPHSESKSTVPINHPSVPHNASCL